MEIKTKFNIGDTAYTMINTDVYRVIIDNIHIKICERYQEISYDVFAHNGYLTFTPNNSLIQEKFLFKTAQDLINSINIIG